LLEALVVRLPDSLEAWQALRELMRTPSPSALFSYADRQVRRLLHREQPLSPRSAVPSEVTPVDEAIAEGRLSAARHLATTAGISPGELALRAVALGRADLGREQADLALAADPTDGDAWVALVAAADLNRDEDELGNALMRLAAHPVPPSPLGTRLLEELLERRVGQDAATAWAAARAGSSPPRAQPHPASAD
jgi:hypothetical protein